MTLTKFERRLLAKQYHILSLLDQSNAAYYEKVQEALEHGYESAYEDEIFAGIFDGLPADESALVIEAMDVYSAIQRSYDALDDKRGSRRGARNSQGLTATTRLRTWVTLALLLRRRDGSAP